MTLPHDHEAERAVLGSMLLERDAISGVMAVIGDSGGAAFHLERHQQLYEVLVALYRAGQAADGVVVKDELVRRGLWDRVGKFDFLGGLLSAVPSALRATSYAEIVRDKWLLRCAFAAAYRVQAAATAQNAEPANVIAEASRESSTLTELLAAGKEQTWADTVSAVYESVQREGSECIPTGIPGLDSAIGGWQPGELVIIGAFPSAGKTAFLLSTLDALTFAGTPCLLFTIEMSGMEVAERLYTMLSGVPVIAQRKRDLTPNQRADFANARTKLALRPLHIDDQSNIAVDVMRARCAVAQRRHGVQVVAVDFVQMMYDHRQRGESRNSELERIIAGIKAIAKDLGLALLVASQRNAEGGLRDSGALEAFGNVVLVMERDKAAADEPADERRRRFATHLIVAKNRSGEAGVNVQLTFDPARVAFTPPRYGERGTEAEQAQDDRVIAGLQNTMGF